jgi:hypothetical protein
MSLRKGVFGRRIILSALLVLTTVSAAFQAPEAHAAQITVRSLAIGSAIPSATTTNLFTFTVPTTGTVGSIGFQYCTTASGTCSTTAATTGVSSGATLTGQSGATGFTLGGNTANTTYITRTAASITGGTVLSYTLSNVVNPSNATATTFFVRITTYTGTNGSTGPVDTGTVAASTAVAIVLTGTMPESLIFCTGATISTTSGIPDCTTATSGSVSFNQLFSPTDTATATSQMAASTNAASGYVITVNGVTLTSGGNTIPAMATTGTGDASVRGTGQFGLNLKLNTTAVSTVAVGLEVAASPNGTDLRGQAYTGYNSVDHFRFVTGDPVAKSDNTVAGPTNAQIFTSSYIVNVAGNQASGTYTSTLTYICTATF